MSGMRAVVGAALGLAVCAAAWGVGPPAAGPARLSREQEARLRLAESRLDAAAYAGRMGEAQRLAQEVESLRRRWQGGGHWEAVDARYEVERWGRLARLPEASRQEAGRGARHTADGMALHARGRYAEAEKSFRLALALSKKALGEGHPETAQGYNNVAYSLQAQGKPAQAQALYEKARAILEKALGGDHPNAASACNGAGLCLQAQGKAAQALPLFERALAVRQKVLGEQHPHTAVSYNCLAGCLEGQGQAVRALPLYEKALAVRRRALGEDHRATALSYNNVAVCLKALARYAQALPLHEKALGTWKRALGEDHPDTALGYDSLASCLAAQGQAVKALPLFEKALAIHKKALGEDHPETAQSYNNVATCLHAQGKLAQAVALYEKALGIWKRALGEEHPHVALCYTNLATCQTGQGKAVPAQQLYEKALAIRQRALGERHPSTAQSYNSVAYCHYAQGKDEQALSLFAKAQAIWKGALGEGHPDTASGYNNIALCLRGQGQPGLALPLYEKGLTLRKKAFGEEHPEVAQSYHNLASCLHAMGKPASALPLSQKALAIRRKTLGEQHPDTAESYHFVALHARGLGKSREAIEHWERALLGHDACRLDRARSGFDRARFGADLFTPRLGLAMTHARLKEPLKAWQYAEANLARNLLDDLAGAGPQDVALAAHLRLLDDRLVPLFGLANPTEDQKALLDELTRQRKDVLARLAREAIGRSAANVWSVERIQKHLPADAAVVLWMGGGSENWACVLRAQGPPRWQALAGTGASGAWTPEDFALPERLLAALADPGVPAAKRGGVTEAVRARWFAPVEKHLRAEGRLPAVRRLFLVPSGYHAKLPMEVIASGHTVSYVPSATTLAKGLAGHRSLVPTPALALGDPVFGAPAPAAPPRHGVMVGGVAPGGQAEKAGLRAGDVLVRYDDKDVASAGGLVAALKKNAKARAVLWRDGKELAVGPPLPLDFRIDRRPGPEAVRAFREANAPATRGEVFAALPGTRAEVRAIQRLLGEGCRTLVGSGASEQALDALAKDLKGLRVLHLATHGEVNLAYPERSRLILARDRLPGVSENAERVAGGKAAYTGELTVDAVLRDWRLDADLVVLSACQTGLGAASQGDGLLGFPYALMRAGARSVVLSRWKVDDKATALLMVRFYENLVGKAKGLKGPMGRAEALAEAKRWLRELPRKEAERLAAALGADRLSGTRGSVVDLDVKDRPKVPAGDRPYAHPYYWAAFTLVGDPD